MGTVGRPPSILKQFAMPSNPPPSRLSDGEGERMERSDDNKSQNKNSFILYLEQAEIVDELSDDDAGKLFKAILFYVHSGEEPKKLS